jgi:hypothetical protein
MTHDGSGFQNSAICGTLGATKRIIRQILAEPPAAEAIDHRHLVEAESVGVVLVHVEAGVVDQELADLWLPEGEDQPAGPLLVGEVEAVVVAPLGDAIEEVETLVPEVAPAWL